MKMNLRLTRVGLALITLLGAEARAQTDGTARLEVTLGDYNGSGAKHWTVAWVTTQSGTFIKTLRRQGPSLTSSSWNSHCSTWYKARGSSTAFDGYSSATASTYSGTNSPVILTWNCRDGSNALVPDGGYKFWVQYAEDSGQGPATTSGLLWTKGPATATTTYPDQSVNFKSMRVVWTPAAPPAPPVIASVRVDGLRLLMSGTGPANASLHTLFSPDPALPMAQWTSIATNTIDGQGGFNTTNAIAPGTGEKFYRLRVP